MSGQQNGVQKHIIDHCPAAIYVHCASHVLNLCLAKASDIQQVRAAITTMHELAVFYCESNKRLLNLQQFIDRKCPDSSRTRLKKHCTTRWMEKQDAVLVFRELYVSSSCRFTGRHFCMGWRHRQQSCILHKSDGQRISGGYGDSPASSGGRAYLTTICYYIKY